MRVVFFLGVSLFFVFILFFPVFLLFFRSIYQDRTWSCYTDPDGRNGWMCNLKNGAKDITSSENLQLRLINENCPETVASLDHRIEFNIAPSEPWTPHLPTNSILQVEVVAVDFPCSWDVCPQIDWNGCTRRADAGGLRFLFRRESWRKQGRGRRRCPTD